VKIAKDICRVALVQAEPVMFDKAAGVQKALEYIKAAASEKAELIVFPELFIPGYPIGMNFGFSIYTMFCENINIFLISYFYKIF